MIRRLFTYILFASASLLTLQAQSAGSATTDTINNGVSADIDTEVREMIAAAKKKATDIITANIDKMHKSARYLLEKETITGEEFMNIFNGA